MQQAAMAEWAETLAQLASPRGHHGPTNGSWPTRGGVVDGMAFPVAAIGEV
jgi:hypothetical protein